MITIIMKNGNLITYRGNDFTDYDWQKEAFIVLKGNQWIGIYNWDCVQQVTYTDEK